MSCEGKKANFTLEINKLICWIFGDLWLIWFVNRLLKIIRILFFKSGKKPVKDRVGEIQILLEKYQEMVKDLQAELLKIASGWFY